jgi:hypothetical protein
MRENGCAERWIHAAPLGGLSDEVLLIWAVCEQVFQPAQDAVIVDV